MNDSYFMSKLRSFFGLGQKPPTSDFRNPIWGSDDEDDGDELYTRQQMDTIDPLDMHREFSRQMHEMFRTFGSMFGDMRSFFHDEHLDSFPAITQTPSEEETYEEPSGNIRDYYLKPGYHRKEYHKEDIDLDGKISSNEISGLLKQKDDPEGPVVPFNGKLVPGRSFCQTIITTSVKKPDGSVETKRIVKNGNQVIEETTTTAPDSRDPVLPGADPMTRTGFIYDNVLSSLFRNFY